MTKHIAEILKKNILMIAMFIGIAYYFIFTEIPYLSQYKNSIDAITGKVLPWFIFIMLFFSFTSISPKEIRFKKWHLWISLFQIIISSISLFILLPFNKEIACSLFICIICPTAVAGAVITDKLGGNVSSLVTYTIIINCLVSIFIPLVISILNSTEEFAFITMMLTIAMKIFPLLVLPIIAIWTIKYTVPSLHHRLYELRNIAFYIWTFSLIILIKQVLEALLEDGKISFSEILIATTSLFACILQFYTGRKIGKHYGDLISARQSLGQKNTIFAIWVSSTFISPIVALGPGMYIIWQNFVNSSELKKHLNNNNISNHKNP